MAIQYFLMPNIEESWQIFEQIDSLASAVTEVVGLKRLAVPVKLGNLNEYMFEYRYFQKALNTWY